jgi:hypothetical protein
MRRVSEKVKDIVEICPFTHLHDFAADPGLTLSGYHFTDITADLMSKWIDRVSAVRSGNGAACALAGFRGVGKSHFLSVLGVIAARPELRAKISDAHVASTAERLSRRHGNVATVRRGSGTTLFDELKRAIAPILGTNPAELTDSLYDLLLRASDQSGDVPLVILIDTAFGRDSRVSRDDGVLLSEIAEAAKAIGVFVGVALDDDISGADGPNAAISRSFAIDYLDQEHLYKIVDSVIFSKHNHMRGVLHDIYEDCRREMQGFRWSEQRFTSLYPLHPAAVEIAPLIRLYIHDFALLGFAAEAGVKILGRPANSLIGLDEVFDGVEAKLRAVPDLTDAFVAFDHLERDVLSKTPVLFRHPAKLILKGLLILSLNGQGASSDEIAASMMIASGGSSAVPSLDVEALLASCVEALPNAIDRYPRENAPAKYCFRIGSKVDTEAVLAQAAKDVPVEAVWRTLLTQTAEKWSDFDSKSALSHCSVEWRGGIRRGELIWPPSDGAEEPSRERRDLPDWTISVEPEGEQTPAPEPETTAVWRVAALRQDEIDAIRRHCVLLQNADVREQIGDGLSTALHVNSIAVEKIWNRVFLRDACIIAGGLSYKFSEEARSAQTLSQLFALSLAPVFESMYPQHPVFAETLGLKQAAGLISSFLSGSAANNSESLRLAETFGIQLNVAERSGDILVPLSAEKLVESDIVKAALSGANTSETIPLSEISERLRATPFGLTREAQHIILAALVAQKQFEFVTSSGNRINYRSLDLQIIWDDIIGLSVPLNEQYSADRLLSWAKLITGNSGLRSIDRAEDREVIIDSLGGWLSGWNQSRVLSDFDSLADENLNASIWRTAANLRKSFGAMADIIGSLISKDLSLEKALQLIADLFSDSESEYESKKVDLRVLRDFTAGVTKRSEIRTYLSLCENTKDDALEQSRAALLAAVEEGRFDAVNPAGDKFVEVWLNFKDMYSAYYIERHDSVMNSAISGDRLKTIIRSDAWCMFESLSSIEWLGREYMERCRMIIREMRQLNCAGNVSDSLKERPFCGCSFSLAETDRLIELPAELEATIAAGIEAYRGAFAANAETLAAAGDSDAMSASVSKTIAALNDPQNPSLTSQEIRILKLAAENLKAGPRPPTVERDDQEIPSIDAATLDLWEDEVQKVEEFVNTEI